MTLWERFYSGYEDKLVRFDSEAREALAECQRDGFVDPSIAVRDMSAEEFPLESVIRIRDADAPRERRKLLLAYLIGAWYRDRIEGSWAYVPRIVEDPKLYLSFGVGVFSGGVWWNAADTASDILVGEDIEQIQAMLEVNIRLWRDGRGVPPAARDADDR